MHELPGNVVKLADYRARLEQDSIIREMLDDAFSAAITAIGMVVFVCATFLFFMVTI